MSPPLPNLQERQADRLRYAGLPSGDHSLVVEGLNQFAPTGSYAHGGNRGGLGDDDDDDEVNRLASNPVVLRVTHSGRGPCRSARVVHVESAPWRVDVGRSCLFCLFVLSF